MSSQNIQWQIPISHKPKIIAAAISTHGPESAPSILLENVWWIHFYPYSATVTLDDIEFPIRPGYVGIVPPGVRATYHYEERATHAVAHFVLPSTGRQWVTVPAMQDIGNEFGVLYTAFEDAIRWFPRNPERSHVRLWDILWRLVDGQTLYGEPNFSSEGYFKAMQVIERRLAEPLRVSEIVAEVGLSSSQLLRQFHASTGTSIQSYIHKRRMDRAVHLLQETQLSLQVICGMVGVPDRRAFNKMINKEFGCSPTDYRKRNRMG